MKAEIGTFLIKVYAYTKPQLREIYNTAEPDTGIENLHR